ncbi:MAG: thiamine pyrophosphate-dependent enzyme [Thermoguttaceae bacterium]|jgi:TPP-dependent pyruvate/acetoin dehydrogenase alpha subunit
MRFEMKMPDLATTESDVRIVRWLIQPGEKVERGQPLVEVETDKATMEVESVVSGVLMEVQAQVDDDVSVGQVIGVLEVEGAPGHNVNTAQESSQGPSSQSAPYERDFLLYLYERMALIRQFEDGIKFLFLEGAMPGTIHQCQGQEATAVGVCSALRADDFITSTFRGHGHALAKGLCVQELLDELFGTETGCCRGRGGSMHVGNMAKGMVPGIAIVGGGIPLAAGMALAFRMQKTDRVVACFFGDGAVAEGAFHEGINMAAIWNLPVIFACENNLYGASTHVSKVMCDTHIARRAASYGLRTQQIDGNDVLVVYDAARAAVADCRAGRGPILLEMLTYRRTGHSRRDPCHYQPKEEREAWAARDPIHRFADAIKGRGLIDDAGLHAIEARLAEEFQAAVEKARRAPPPPVQGLTTDVLV